MILNSEVQVGPFGLYLAPRKPRKERAQRYQWKSSASMRPYLIEHPEREIAEARGALGLMVCEACDERQVYEAHWTGTAVQQAIAAAHQHNAARHPRRWLRSQHFQAPIPAEVRERAVSA